MAGMATADIYPGYFSNIETGSSFFGPQVSAATSANSRFVSATATTPISLGYSVSFQGIGTGSAWIDARILEGRAGIPLANYIDATGTAYDEWLFNPDLSMNTGKVLAGSCREWTFHITRRQLHRVLSGISARQ